MLAKIFINVLQVISTFYMTIVLLRFMLQVVRADFYNPISQFVVKATNPLLLPLRKVIPGIGGLDIASIVLALLLQSLVFFLIFLAMGKMIVNPLTLLLWSAITLLALISKVYFFAILGAIILSWVAQGSYHPAVQLLHQLTEPVMRPFRKLVPPMGGLDLSPMLIFIVLMVVDMIIAELAMRVGAPMMF